MFAIEFTGSDHTFLNSCYRHVLGRLPDAEGLASWMQALSAQHMRRSEIVRWMLSCDERLSLHPRPAVDFESLVERLYRALLRPGCVALDVGAHAGRHSLPLLEVLTNGRSDVAPTSQLFLVEPLPWLARRLTENAQISRATCPVTLFNGVLSDAAGHAQFSVALDRPEESALRQKAAYDSATKIELITVEVRRIDTWLGGLSRLDFIKIDVEGAEYNVFCGAAQTIARLRPVIAFECGARSLGGFGHAANAVFDSFAQHDYQIFDILGTGLSRDAFAISMAYEHIWDYVAVPQEQADRVANLLKW